jgi:hypothetical protein
LQPAAPSQPADRTRELRCHLFGLLSGLFGSLGGVLGPRRCCFSPARRLLAPLLVIV